MEYVLQAIQVLRNLVHAETDAVLFLYISQDIYEGKPTYHGLG